MIDEGQHHTYSDDWRRTNPDLVFFLPPAPPAWQESVDHVLVSLTREGALLAIWTYCTKEHAADESIMVRRSEDGGTHLDRARTCWPDPAATRARSRRSASPS